MGAGTTHLGLYDATTDGAAIVEVRANGDISSIFENATAAHLLGSDARSFERSSREPLASVARTGVPERFDHESAADRWLDCFAFKPAHVGPGRVVVLVRDATGVRRQRASLWRSEQRRLLAVEAAHVGDWSYDAATGTLNDSPILRAMHGVPADVPVTLEMHDAMIHDDDVAKVRAARVRSVGFDPSDERCSRTTGRGGTRRRSSAR